MTTVLVVEDEREVADFVAQSLRENGCSVDIAADGEEALGLAQFRDYDAVILDMILPKKNGLEVLSELRNQGKATPVLILTTRASIDDRVRGLDAGADDYLAKPFALNELHARLRALLRRGGSLAQEHVVCGPLELDRIKHTVKAEGKTLELSQREYQLLEHFMLRPDVTVRRTELLEQVWGLSLDPGTNLVDVHVSNLRGKLRAAGHDGLIKTVRGVGFRFEAPESEARRQ